jgi:hypothetical protein
LGVITILFCHEHEPDEYLKTYHGQYFVLDQGNRHAKEIHITVRGPRELKSFLFRFVPLIQDKEFLKKVKICHLHQVITASW